MNIKGKLVYLVPGSVIFLLIYVFIAVKPVAPEFFFQPVWTTTLPESPLAFDSTAAFPDTAEAFILGDRFGYFTPEGTILFSRQFEAMVSASNRAWCAYPTDVKTTEVFQPNGTKLFTLNGAGFLHLDRERAYLFLPGGNGLSQISESGTVLWTYENTAPITAFNSSPSGTVVGYADGKLVCLDADGSEKMSFFPGGSDQQVILGAAISEDGSMIACVSGIDKQRFLLLKYTGNHYKVATHLWLEGNLKRQAFVAFEENAETVLFETQGALGLLDTASLRSHFIPAAGQILTAGRHSEDGVFVVLAKNGNEYTLSAVEKPDHQLAATTFTANNAFLIQRGQSVFLGIDRSISRLDIRGNR